MSESKIEKRKPMEERIASLFGKSSYIDLRDGLGGTNPLRIRDQDVAAALGAVSRKLGGEFSMALETHYGSTLLHLSALERLWDKHQRKPKQTQAEIILYRVGFDLAMREFIGFRFCASDMARYAYIFFSRRDALEQKKKEAYVWLDELKTEALSELRRQLRETRQL